MLTNIYIYTALNYLSLMITMKSTSGDTGLTRDEKLKESENDPLRMDDPGEDLSLELGLRPAEPDE